MKYDTRGVSYPYEYWYPPRDRSLLSFSFGCDAIDRSGYYKVCGETGKAR